jgi:NitT/TauT family transport system permease protein
MKTAVPLVVGVVVIGEFVDGQKGLGYLMLAAAFKLETSLVFAALAAVMLIGLILYGAVVFAELALVRRRRT